VEAERRSDGDDAAALRAFPPVAAGDGAVLKVMEEGSPLRHCSGSEELSSRPSQKSKVQITLM